MHCLTGSPRFTSGATSADLSMASLADELFSSMYLVSRHWWDLKLGSFVLQMSALPTELCQLGLGPPRLIEFHSIDKSI